MSDHYEITTIDLYAITLGTIQTWLMQVYQNALRTPDYVLMNREDYDAFVTELARYAWKTQPTPEEEIPLEKHVLYVSCAVNGKMFRLAPLPDMPCNRHYAAAHLAFAQAGYEALPALKRNEFIALFPRC